MQNCALSLFARAFFGPQISRIGTKHSSTLLDTVQEQGDMKNKTKPHKHLWCVKLYLGRYLPFKLSIGVRLVTIILFTHAPCVHGKHICLCRDVAVYALQFYTHLINESSASISKDTVNKEQRRTSLLPLRLSFFSRSPLATIHSSVKSHSRAPRV